MPAEKFCVRFTETKVGRRPAVRARHAKAIAGLRSEHVREPQLVGGGILQEQLGLNLVQMRQHLRARGLPVAFANRGDDPGVMIGAAGRRVMPAVKQDDERGARDQLLEKTEIDAVATHLGDEPMEVAGETDRSTRIATLLRLAFLGKMPLETPDP